MLSIKILLIIACCFLINSIESKHRNSNRKNLFYSQPWPKPQMMSTTNVEYTLNEKQFKFRYTNQSIICDIVTNAFARYYNIIFKPEEAMLVSNIKRRKSFFNLKRSLSNEFVETLHVEILTDCEDYPHLESDEFCMKKFIRIFIL
jgi:hypothetical protein